jgi:hypothetical protein
MSERETGIGTFVLGVALGVTLGLMFAREGGDAFRGKVTRRLRALRDLAGDHIAGELERLSREEDAPVG